MFRGVEARRERGIFAKTALLNEVKEGGQERDQKRGVGGQKKNDMEEDPAGVNHGEGGVLLARVEGRDEAEKEAEGQDEDA